MSQKHTFDAHPRRHLLAINPTDAARLNHHRGGCTMTEQELADELWDVMGSAQDIDSSLSDLARAAAERVFDLIASGELAAPSTTIAEAR